MGEWSWKQTQILILEPILNALLILITNLLNLITSKQIVL